MQRRRQVHQLMGHWYKWLAQIADSCSDHQRSYLCYRDHPLWLRQGHLGWVIQSRGIGSRCRRRCDPDVRGRTVEMNLYDGHGEGSFPRTPPCKTSWPDYHLRYSPPASSPVRWGVLLWQWMSHMRRILRLSLGIWRMTRGGKLLMLHIADCSRSLCRKAHLTQKHIDWLINSVS